MSRRVAAFCALAALAVGAGAFLLGAVTAPESTPAGAPTAEGPNGIEVPPLGGAAALPQLSKEAPAPVAEAAGEEGEATIGEAPVEEAPAPVEEEAPESSSPEATPAPSAPSNEVVPEGL